MFFAGLSLAFLTTLLQTWLSVSTLGNIGAVLRKAGINGKLLVCASLERPMCRSEPNC